MKKKQHWLLLTLLISFLTACSEPERAQQARFYAFGTEIDISLFGVDQQAATNTIEALEASFKRTNALWHAWEPSVLMDINAAITARESIEIDDNVAAVILHAKQLAEDSNHLFNPAAGKLFALWGFESSDWPDSRPPPQQTDIDRWLIEPPSMSDIIIENGVLRSQNPQVQLGFGGFAKGYAVDAAIEVLRAQGIENAVVNMGGDLRAIGRHGPRPWIIGVRHPRHEGVLASMPVSGDESVFSSGDYERFFEYDGERYPHILDPRTGYPADFAMSVTVIHNNASKADAAATALFVAGENWPAVAAQLEVEHVMLMTREGEVQMSPAMQKRVKLTGHMEPAVIRDIPTL